MQPVCVVGGGCVATTQPVFDPYSQESAVSIVFLGYQSEQWHEFIRLGLMGTCLLLGCLKKKLRHALYWSFWIGLAFGILGGILRKIVLAITTRFRKVMCNEK